MTEFTIPNLGDGVAQGDVLRVRNPLPAPR
jgi:hypothetical protein